MNDGLFARDLKYLVASSHTFTARRSDRRQRGAVLLGLVASVSIGGLGLLSIGGDEPQAAVAAEPAVVADIPPTKFGLRANEISAPSPTPAVGGDFEGIDVDERSAQADEPPMEWIKHRIARGETLSSIFKKRGLEARQAFELGRKTKLKRLTRMRAGRELRLGLRAGELAVINYDIGGHRWLNVVLGDEGIEVTEIDAEFQRKERFAGGIIESSLFKAGATAGLTDKLVMQLSGIFGWDVDFALDLRPGDEFKVIYEELFDDGQLVGDGDILAAEFINRGQRHQAFRFVHDNERVEYYDLEGRSLRGTFLRSPVKFSRITSGFTNKRFHPILKKWRSHKGIDYGAPRGTPVLATADGKVNFMGRKGGYGKTISLRHGGRFSTLYAHLSSYKRGLKTGARVKQGQILGFVGSTGLATGPHLHYEFRVSGIHRNPLTYDMPKNGELERGLRPAFLAQAQRWIDQFDTVQPTQVAIND